jgi:opacity protein-like surface antigen
LNGARGQVVHVDGTVSVTDFMVNGILEKANFVSKEMPVSLFLIVGAGIASASVTDVSYNGTTLIAAGKNTQFAYQGGLGVGNELTRNITVDLTYKYLSASQFNFSGVKGDYGSHNIIVGARYVF